jgi:hypothetical protein
VDTLKDDDSSYTTVSFSFFTVEVLLAGLVVSCLVGFLSIDLTG